MGISVTPNDSIYATRQVGVPLTCPMTFSAWCYYPSGLTGQNYYGLIGTGPNTDNAGFALMLFSNGTMLASTISPADETTTQNVEDPNTILFGGSAAWMHFCAVWDDGGTPGQCASCILYRNGSVAASNTWTPLAGYSGTTDNQVTSIGCVEYFVPSTGVFGCGGYCAYPGIWGAALTAGEVNSLYKGMSPKGVRPSKLLSAPRLSQAPLTGPIPDLTGSYYNVTGGSISLTPNPRIFDPY